MHDKQQALASEIESQDYLRQRLDPQHGDPLYLHLSDIRRALGLVSIDTPVKLLDYGCGGSPYRQLYPQADYKRADYLQTGDLDYILKEDSTVKEKSNTFDVILSTQVLEHVKKPEIYLNECIRLLNSGGKLILTTHGIYEDHACPDDFKRWTADGLKLECEKVGFHVDDVVKLTTGPRALMFLFELYRDRFGKIPNDALGDSFNSFLATTKKDRAYFHRWCDGVYSENRLASYDDRQHSIYIALILVATK